MQRRVSALARDRVSGASALARRAAELLRSAARHDGKSLAQWQREVQAASAAVAAAQPAMASLLTVAEIVRRAAEAARTPAGGARALERALALFLRRQPRALGRATQRVARLLPPRATCLTLSASEAVYRALLAARRRGRLARVVVAESLPGGEGVPFARRLAARGVTVSVIADALGAAVAREVDAVLVGADAITRSALWNKCGTLGLALAARAARRPFHVVTTGDRLVGGALARHLRVPEHVSGRRPTRLERLYDVTPLRLVTYVVTETGVMTPAAVRATLGSRAAGC